MAPRSRAPGDEQRSRLADHVAHGGADGVAVVGAHGLDQGARIEAGLLAPANQAAVDRGEQLGRWQRRENMAVEAVIETRADRGKLDSDRRREQRVEVGCGLDGLSADALEMPGQAAAQPAVGEVGDRCAVLPAVEGLDAV